MRTVEVSGDLERYTRGLRKRPLVFTRNGKPIAALVTLEGIDPESAALSMSPDFMKIIQRSRQSLRTRGGLTLEEVRARLK